MWSYSPDEIATALRLPGTRTAKKAKFVPSRHPEQVTQEMHDILISQNMNRRLVMRTKLHLQYEILPSQCFPKVLVSFYMDVLVKIGQIDCKSPRISHQVPASID